MTDTLDQMSLDGHLYPHGVTNQNLQTLERSRVQPLANKGGGRGGGGRQAHTLSLRAMTDMSMGSR